jgi:hypothetical protein
MRATIGAGLLCLFGCNHGGLPSNGSKAPPPDDLATMVSAPADFALPSLDLASACRLAMPNATTALAGNALLYAWIGNVDGGGEAHCGGPPEDVVIVLSADPSAENGELQRTSFGLTLPVQLGTHSATAYTELGGEQQADATVEVTGLTILSDGSGGMDTLQGSVDSPTLGLSGQFSASHCPYFDVTCI